MATDVASFVDTVWKYYDEHGRHDLPWRTPSATHMFDPYAIMVSEVMLQQTQVPRAIVKYHEFLHVFPTVSALAKAPLAEVLKTWSGLGYNRRAKFLWQAAQNLEAMAAFPRTVPELVQLPGIGINTAGAIAAYAFDRPVVFIETNIRSVYIHHFFADHDAIADAQLLPLVQESMDIVLQGGRSPRQWYWALMDYGTYLKQTVGNVSRKSKTYARQSKFEGSRRQIRGQVLKLLANQPHTAAELAQVIADQRLHEVIEALKQESFISLREEHYHLGSP